MISVRNPSKEKARNFSYHQEISGFFVLKLTIYWSMGFIVGTCTIHSFYGYILIRHWSYTAIYRKLPFHQIMYYSITLSAFGTRFGT